VKVPSHSKEKAEKGMLNEKHNDNPFTREVRRREASSTQLLWDMAVVE